MKHRINLTLPVAETPVAATSVCLAGLTAAAALRRRGAPPTLTSLPRFVVLVPPRDEERVIDVAVRSLLAVDYPRDRFELTVVADNCSVRTAERARAAGASVLERDEPDLPGKGHAIACALDRVNRRDNAVMLVDADCEAAPRLLRAAAARIARAASAVQCYYVVSNPGESLAAALGYAALTLGSAVRVTGASALVLSCGLLGTAMAFAPGVLGRMPWRSFSLVEDREQHLRLVHAGERVEFCPEASARSPMPVSLAAAADQQLRWQAGRFPLARRWTPRLLRSALAERDAVKDHSALEQAPPPASLVGIVPAVAGGLPLVSSSGRGRRMDGVCAMGQAVHVFALLALARSPYEVWLALALVSAVAGEKAAIFVRMASGRGPSSWIRTERAGKAGPRSAPVYRVER